MGKVSHWNYIRTLVKKDFDRKGIRHCEQCGSTSFLTFAHRLKRRFIKDDHELRYGLALLCVTDHQKLEAMPHEQMYEAITAIIDNRREIFDAA